MREDSLNENLRWKLKVIYIKHHQEQFMLNLPSFFDEVKIEEFSRSHVHFKHNCFEHEKFFCRKFSGKVKAFRWISPEIFLKLYLKLYPEAFSRPFYFIFINIGNFYQFMLSTFSHSHFKSFDEHYVTSKTFDSLRKFHSCFFLSHTPDCSRLNCRFPCSLGFSFLRARCVFFAVALAWKHFKCGQTHKMKKK